MCPLLLWNNLLCLLIHHLHVIHLLVQFTMIFGVLLQLLLLMVIVTLFYLLMTIFILFGYIFWKIVMFYSKFILIFPIWTKPNFIKPLNSYARTIPWSIRIQVFYLFSLDKALLFNIHVHTFQKHGRANDKHRHILIFFEHNFSLHLALRSFGEKSLSLLYVTNIFHPSFSEHLSFWMSIWYLIYVYNAWFKVYFGTFSLRKLLVTCYLPI